MEGYIDVCKLTLEELVGVVNLYPWFAGARKELCLRMGKMSAESWSDRQFSDAALHIPDRRILADIVRSATQSDWTDGDADNVVKQYEETKAKEQTSVKRVYAGAGDYFSQEDYDKARVEEDNVFSRYAAKARAGKMSETVVTSDPVFDMYTETLAEIYSEQGYYAQAREIYSKLILAYPEKNAYFAALIQKIDELK